MRRRSILPADTWACLSLAAICAALFLLAGLDEAGIWDPHELDRAELARRIAIHSFGADLEVAGEVSTMPTLTDLGAGELGFTSMAAGYATWGLHEFAGRLPLALWCLAGVLAVFAFMARAVSPRAGMFAAIALSTMPVYFLQARTMLGDAVTLAAFAMCFFGVAGALVERATKPALVFLGLGMVGGLCGFLSRGWLIGVVAPTLGVALAWVALVGTGDSMWRMRRRVGVGGLAFTVAGVGAWLGAGPLIAHGHAIREVKRGLGMAVTFAPAPESTFDLTLRELGHGLFPWSAFVPCAFGVVIATAPKRPPNAQASARFGARTILLVGAACAYGVHAALAPFTGPMAFAGVSILAAIVGLAIHDLDDSTPGTTLLGTRAVAVGTLLFLGVLLRDMIELPDKGLVAFAVPEAELPLNVAASLSRYLVAAAGVFGLFVMLAWLSPESSPESGTSVRARIRSRVAQYEELARELSQVWAGNLAFGFLVLEAALLGMGATMLIGRRLGWSSVSSMSYSWAYVGLNLWWFIPLALVTVPLALDVLLRAYSWLLGKVGAPRSLGLLVAALGAGGVMCFGYYGAMAEQLSPKQALHVYASRHRTGEPLGLLAVNPRVGRYYAHGDATTSLSSARAAVRWLATEPDGPLRWMAFREGQLAELNALYRKAHARNLPVVQTGAGQILLAQSRVTGGEMHDDNANPLAPFVRSSAPTEIQVPVEARFGDQLRVLGWDVIDGEGNVVPSVPDGRGNSVPSVAVGTTYRMRLYLHVEQRIARSYRAFIHIDAAGRRHNGDHQVLGGRYPTTYWQEGDYIVDEHAFTLERHFRSGRYAVYFGFYIFKDRLPVTEGRHHEDRLIGGVLAVR